MAYGPEVFLLSLSHEGLQFLKPGRAVPNNVRSPVYYKRFSNKGLKYRPLEENHNYTDILFFIHAFLCRGYICISDAADKSCPNSR